MAKRVVIGGILGGLAMFVWLFVAHDVLPLGELGVQQIANDGPVLTAMQAAIPQAGLYLFPGMGLGPNPTMQQRNAAMPAYMKKYEQSLTECWSTIQPREHSILAPRLRKKA